MKPLLQNLHIYTFLLVATLIVYSPVRNFDYVNFDDPDYSTANPHLRSGLNADNVAWAFTSSYAANWIPLTWVSHMLDAQLFGLRAGPRHVINFLLHTLATLILFAALLSMTGARWPSALVAFLFALHPLHVESVAWIAERKDVLCAFFCFLALWCYARYVERPERVRYALVLAAFACALLSKPMAVTLPLVLLLLDLWPLKRLSQAAVIEKIPLFVLSAACALITYGVQKSGGAVMTFESIPFAARMENAIVSCVTYLIAMVWPVGLAVFYPFPGQIPTWEAAAAGVFIAGMSILAWRCIRMHPYFAVGWFWYLITLAPVIGVLQVGEQSHADRYTYIPLAGIFIALAWGLAEAAERWPRSKIAVAVLTVAACLVCTALTDNQIRYWQNSQTLFEHALQVTDGNYVAYNNLGVALRDQGRLADAIPDYQAAIRIKPDSPDAHDNLGEAYLKLGRIEAAVPELQQAIGLNPDLSQAHINLGTAFDKLGKLDESRAQFLRALNLDPGNAEAHEGLGSVLADQGKPDDAIHELTEAIRIKPEYADAHYNLGLLYASMNRAPEAAAQFSEAVRLDPGNPQAHYNLGIALGSQGLLEAAAREFAEAVRLKPDYANAHFNLGGALASLGRLNEAAQQFSEALRIKPDFAQARESLAAVKDLQK